MNKPNIFRHRGSVLKISSFNISLSARKIRKGGNVREEKNKKAKRTTVRSARREFILLDVYNISYWIYCSAVPDPGKTFCLFIFNLSALALRCNNIIIVRRLIECDVMPSLTPSRSPYWLVGAQKFNTISIPKLA